MIFIRYLFLSLITNCIIHYHCSGQGVSNSFDNSSEYYRAIELTVRHLDSLKFFFDDKDLRNGIINLEVTNFSQRKIPSQIGKYKINLLGRKQLNKKTESSKPVLVTVLYPMELKNGFFIIRAGYFTVTQFNNDKYLYGNRGGLNVVFEFSCTSKKLDFVKVETTDQ